MRQGGREATGGCGIKQFAEMTDWGSVLPGKPGRHSGPCLRAFPSKGQGSWGIQPYLGAAPQEDGLPGMAACPTLECTGLQQPMRTLG